MLDSTDKEDVSITNDLNSEEASTTPQTSVMMMASFRVDREVWAKFGAIAKRERLTATDVLTQYIQRCTDNDKTEYGVRIDNVSIVSINTYDTDRFNEAVMMAISTLSLCSHDDVSKRIDDAIDNRVSPLIESHTDRLTELETYTRSQFAAVNDELIPPSSHEEVPTENQPLVKTATTTSQEKSDGDTKTWRGFFEMVGMSAMTATEAQKKDNVDIRTQQIEQGLQAAREKGLGEWAVKRAGRDFVRVEAPKLDALPLLLN